MLRTITLCQDPISHATSTNRVFAQRVVRAMLVALVANIAVTSSALACCPEPEYFATVYLDAFGQRLTSSSRQKGLQSLNEQTVNSKTFDIAAQNNLCPTTLVANRLKSAKRFCDRALHLGTMDSRRGGANGQCSDRSAMLAIVHSNLGVVFALSGETAKAEASFSEALRLDPQQDVAARNLVTLGSLCSAVNAVAVW